MTIREKAEWQNLCWEAMHEENPVKLLALFLELSRAAERETRTESLSRFNCIHESAFD